MTPVASGSTLLRRLLAFIACGVAAALLASAALAQESLAMYCSSPNTAWCQGMATGFERAAGVKVSVTQKATGELFAQIKAEAANPKGDIWWAGPGDAFLQAAEEGLLDTYRSPNLGQLHDWARREAELSQYRVAGVYGGILALGYNTEVFAKKKLPVPKCWKDLTDPVYKGEVMLSNPNSSGTAYLMLATLVQIFGEDEAFRYMKALNTNVNQYRADGRGHPWRVRHRQHRAARRDQRDRPGLPGQGDHAVRRRRIRSRLDGDHQGRAQLSQCQKIL
jgi:iron(III) transport system substrate-binding protein